MTMPDEDNMSTEVGAENSRDEMDILDNQDETDTGSTSRDDALMGAGSTDFEENYELDVKDQMDRAMRTRAGTERANPDYRAIESEDAPAERLDNEDNLTSSSERDNARFAKSHRGGSTGAFTDVGAGRSGVTRQ